MQKVNGRVARWELWCRWKIGVVIRLMDWMCDWRFFIICENRWFVQSDLWCDVLKIEYKIYFDVNETGLWSRAKNVQVCNRF